MDRLRVDRRTLLAAGAAGLTGLAGCIGDSGSPFDDGNGGSGDGWTIRIGALIPQSGALERFSTEIEDGITLAQRQFEAITDPDYELDIEVRDSETDPDATVEAGQELVDDGYEIIVGPGTGESLGALTEEVLQPDSAMAISPLAAANLTNIDNDSNFFTTCPRTRALARGMERPIAMERRESVSIIHSSSPYGNNIEEGLAQGLSDRGIEVQTSIEIDEDEDSDSSPLEDATAEDPDGIVFACEPKSGIPLLETYFEEYDPVHTFLPDRMRFRDLQSEIGADMEETQIVSLTPGWEQVAVRDMTGDEEVEDEVEVEDDDRLEWFDQAFEAEYDRHPSIHAAQAYDGAVMMALGAIAVGEDDYDGGEIGRRLTNVTNHQTQYQGVRNFGVDDYWEGLGEIADGVRNNYTGASGDIDFNNSTGLRETLALQAVRFDAESGSGFEETYPII